MDKYEQLEIIGEGSYGLVMKCRHRETNVVVAIKKFLETEEDATIRKMAFREIRMLKRLKHENLVPMIEVFRHKKRFYLVFEYLKGTVLDELDKAQSGLGEQRCRDRIFQVLRGIAYCHNNHVIHRDVKPENVLVSSLGVVKLCDFGFARLISTSGETCTEYVATRWYRAPELLVGEPVYGPAIDVWAIGCLFSEMMTGDPLFPGESDIDQIHHITKLLGPPCLRHQQILSQNENFRAIVKFPEVGTPLGLCKWFANWSSYTVDFLGKCLKMDPNDRSTANELLSHSFFTHDMYPQKFLLALRERVCTELDNPLLRKYKNEILTSTDKKNEFLKKPNDTKWRFSFTEGTVKRKLNNEFVNKESRPPVDDHNILALSATAQRLNMLKQRMRQIQTTFTKHQDGKDLPGFQSLTKGFDSQTKGNQIERAKFESLPPLNVGDFNSQQSNSYPSKVHYYNADTFRKMTNSRQSQIIDCSSYRAKNGNDAGRSKKKHPLEKSTVFNDNIEARAKCKRKRNILDISLPFPFHSKEYG
ncbi:unnamed protein product [Phyllotreta striolata]|uniref:cyclin-dependent kinase n=1 Tax=Phyllotreta striolata TaxID=444603 RepID=A0A9N9TYI0_PHYSR|nr:unnamed protein product [Phyllotreta striolata]